MMKRKKTQAITVLSEVDTAHSKLWSKSADGWLTAAQRRKLGEIEFANVTPLIEQIAKRYEVFNAVKAVTDIPALSEQEVVQRVLYLASPAATAEQRAVAMIVCADCRLLSHGWGLPDVTLLTAQPAQQAIHQWWDSIAKVRADFQRAVVLTKENPDAARKKYSARILEALEQITPVPQLVWDGRRSDVQLRLYSRSTAAACGYALMLLQDERRSLGDWLRLCKHESCNRPFIGIPAPGGSPPSAYCSAECKTNAKRELTAKRVERWRDRKAKEAK